MKIIKKTLAVLLVFVMALSIVACSKDSSESHGSSEREDSTNTTENSTGNGETYIFTDSVGREVEMPKNIERIVPSGPLAQALLFSLCPDKVVGWTAEFSDSENQFIQSKYASLPIFGNFYADTLNLEAVMLAKPQVIVDIGEAKSSVSEDMNGVQDKTGIPSIFIEMKLDSLAKTYETLGKLVGEEQQATKIIEYINKVFSQTEDKLKDIPEKERKSVYFAQGDGLSAFVAKTAHTEVIDFAGGINVAQVKSTMRGGVGEISMEQLLIWNPDVMLFNPGSVYSDVDKKAEWKELGAVKNKTFYEVPSEPYNWMGSPPSVNRIFGIIWLSNLLYPEIFDYDMKAEIQQFYALFYHCDISTEQAEKLLNK